MRRLLVIIWLGLAILHLAQPSRSADEVAAQEQDDAAARAKRLALKVHAQAAAMEHLPKFFYRVKYGNADVANMRDREECSIKGLKEALDGPIDNEHWFQSGATLAWTESQALYSEGEREGAYFKGPADTWRHDRVWTKELAFARSTTADTPAKFNYSRPNWLWGGVQTFLAYFRVTPRHFWWATSDDHNDTISSVPPEEADYRFVTRQPFDDEACDVVESPSRAERLWIGRLSGRLRGLLTYRDRGGELGNFYQHPRVEKIAGTRFTTLQEYRDWYQGTTISARQKMEVARAWNEVHFDQFKPNELIRFRDYREVTPGVWIPFREDRAFTHPAKSGPNRRQYIHLWVAVEEVRTDVDLTERVESLCPREGEDVQDMRFGEPIHYTYKRGRTNDELQGLVEAERKRRLAKTPAPRRAEENLIGSPAPVLSGKVWLNADRPPSWEALRGKTVLLALLDLSQPSFLPLVPPLLGFQEMYGKQGLVVIGVHAKGPREDVATRLANEHITFPVLIDDGQTTERYGIGYSACLLIDREGKVVSVYKDSLAPPAEIEKLLERRAGWRGGHR